MTKEEKGFTLTETMVVVVVFTAVMSLAMVVFLASIRTQRFALFQQRITMETEHAMSRAENIIREKGNITESEIREFLSEAITIERFDVYPEDISGAKKITVILETEMKIDEERDVNIKLQATTNKN